MPPTLWGGLPHHRGRTMVVIWHLYICDADCKTASHAGFATRAHICGIYAAVPNGYHDGDGVGGYGEGPIDDNTGTISAAPPYLSRGLPPLGSWHPAAGLGSAPHVARPLLLRAPRARRFCALRAPALRRLWPPLRGVPEVLSMIASGLDDIAMPRQTRR